MTDWIPMIVTVSAGVITALIGAYFTVKKTQNDRINEQITIGINSIVYWLDQIVTLLDNKRIYKNKVTLKEYHYIHRKISTIPIESLVYSGSFLYFPEELQKKLDKFHFYIKIHNENHEKLESLIIDGQSRYTLKPTSVIIIENLMHEMSIYEHLMTKRLIQDILNEIKLI